MRALSSVLLFVLVACGGGPKPTPRPVDPSVAETAVADESPSAASESTSESSADAPVEAVPEGKFRIQLSRKSRVGDKARLLRTVTDLMKQRAVLDGRMIKNDVQRRMARLEAVLETLAVDAEGRATRTRYTIEKFEARGPKGFQPILPPKTVLTVERRPGKGGSISSSTGALNETQRQLLKLVISTRQSKVSDQQIFGSQEPRAPGESWPIDVDQARLSLTDEANVIPGTLQGNTTFVGIKEVDGIPCLELLSRMEAGDLELTNLPPGTVVERGVLRMRAVGLLPKDPRLPALRQGLSMTMEVRTRTKDAKGTLITDVTSERESDARMTPAR